MSVSVSVQEGPEEIKYTVVLVIFTVSEEGRLEQGNVRYCTGRFDATGKSGGKKVCLIV